MKTNQITVLWWNFHKSNRSIKPKAILLLAFPIISTINQQNHVKSFLAGLAENLGDILIQPIVKNTFSAIFVAIIRCMSVRTSMHLMVVNAPAIGQRVDIYDNVNMIVKLSLIHGILATILFVYGKKVFYINFKVKICRKSKKKVKSDNFLFVPC